MIVHIVHKSGGGSVRISAPHCSPTSIASFVGSKHTPGLLCEWHWSKIGVGHGATLQSLPAYKLCCTHSYTFVSHCTDTEHVVNMKIFAVIEENTKLTTHNTIILWNEHENIWCIWYILLFLVPVLHFIFNLRFAQ